MQRFSYVITFVLSLLFLCSCSRQKPLSMPTAVEVCPAGTQGLPPLCFSNLNFPLDPTPIPSATPSPSASPLPTPLSASLVITGNPATLTIDSFGNPVGLSTPVTVSVVANVPTFQASPIQISEIDGTCVSNVCRFKRTGEFPLTVTVSGPGQSVTLRGFVYVKSQNEILTPHALYIRQLYYDIFGHPPDSAGLAFYVGLLDSGTYSRFDVALELVFSPESHAIDAEYLVQTLLGHTGAGGPNYAGLLNSGARQEDIIAAICSSAEYTVKKGLTDDQYIASLYSDLLGRWPETWEVNLWKNALGTDGRLVVARRIAKSEEAYNRLVTNFHINIIKRLPNPTELPSWSQILLQGARYEHFVATLLSKNEYTNRVAGLPPISQLALTVGPMSSTEVSVPVDLDGNGIGESSTVTYPMYGSRKFTGASIIPTANGRPVATCSLNPGAFADLRATFALLQCKFNQPGTHVIKFFGVSEGQTFIMPLPTVTVTKVPPPTTSIYIGQKMGPCCDVWTTKYGIQSELQNQGYTVLGEAFKVFPPNFPGTENLVQMNWNGWDDVVTESEYFNYWVPVSQVQHFPLSYNPNPIGSISTNAASPRMYATKPIHEYNGRKGGGDLRIRVANDLRNLFPSFYDWTSNNSGGQTPVDRVIWYGL